MSDLISRETVKKGLGDLYDRMRNDFEYVNSPESLFLLATAFTKVDHVIDCTPVVEPKKGEWEPEKVWTYGESKVVLSRCNQCGAIGQYRKYNFCPWCGADMRGERYEPKAVSNSVDR